MLKVIFKFKESGNEYSDVVMGWKDVSEFYENPEIEVIGIDRA